QLDVAGARGLGWIYDTKRPLAVTDVKQPGGRAVADVVGIIRKFDGIQEPEGFSIEALAGAIPTARHKELVELGEINDALRLLKADDGVDPLAGSQVEDLYRVIAQRRHEQVLALEVHGEMIDATGDARHGNGLDQAEGLRSGRQSRRQKERSECSGALLSFL